MEYSTKLDAPGIIRPGDEVRFANPMTVGEEIERFMVLELRGERVLVAMKNSDMRIVPTFAYLTTDMQAV